MDPVDAEEYTQALGQVVAGGWRQIALGVRLGVPFALGLSTSEWVEQRLGGYIRLSVPERRDAARELTTSLDEGGQGMSTRDAAAVLGVGTTTIKRDRHGPNGPVEKGEPPSEEDVTGPNGPSEVCEERDQPAPLPVVVKTNPEKEDRAEEEKAELGNHVWVAMMGLSEWADYDPHDVAESIAVNRLPYIQGLVERLSLFLGLLLRESEKRQARQPVALSTERIVRGRENGWRDPA